jgi:hypothetical protein
MSAMPINMTPATGLELIADGPDEVHRILIAKNVLHRYEKGDSWDFAG